MAELSQISQRVFRWRWVLACLLLACLGTARAEATAPQLERQVKAAYLYKFAGFVEWPESSFARPDSPLQIGVAGSDLLADLLEKMVAGRSVNGRPIRVRRIAPGEALTDLHILFIDHSLERTAMTQMLGAAQGHSLLTVSDAEEASSAGCMINFVVADDKLRFDVMMRHVTSSRLRISARMLAVAHRVRGAS
jgi:hypothetical protein